MYVVPEPSERCTTVMSVAGSVTPGFSFAIAGSFHFVILPRKMSARTGPVNFSSALTLGNVVDGHDGAEHRREVQDLAGRRLQLLVGHRAVGRAEEHRLVGDLPDAAARADRLVVDLARSGAACCTRRTTSSRSDTGTSRPRR